HKDKSNVHEKSTHKAHLTFPEMMALADRLRHEQDSFTKNSSFIARSLTEVSDDYTRKNLVATDIEIEYQQDFKEHQAYQQVLVATGYRQSDLRNALREHVLQLRDRHVERFNAGQFSRRSHGRQRRSVFDEGSFNR
ncbi:unnamed protein product, partial [Candidula unifasciata]